MTLRLAWSPNASTLPGVESVHLQQGKEGAHHDACNDEFTAWVGLVWCDACARRLHRRAHHPNATSGRVVQQEVICRPLLCVAALVVVCATSGCSASRTIALRANAIRDRADEIITVTDRMDATSADVKQIRSNATQIRAAVADIHGVLPSVEDQTPWWATLLGWLAIAAAGVALAWILTASGALSALRVAFGWLPRRAVNEAEMAASTLATDRPETVREWIAMKRSTDREFDAAWRRQARGKARARPAPKTP